MSYKYVKYSQRKLTPQQEIKELKRKLANSEEAHKSNDNYYSAIKSENEQLRNLVLDAIGKALRNQEKH